MQMGRPGTNAWKNALRYAIRILYLRTTSGVLTLTDLLGLPVTQRNVSMHVYLVAALSLRLNQRKLTKSNQTGLQNQHLLFRNPPHDLQSLNQLPKMKTCQALLHSCIASYNANKKGNLTHQNYSLHLPLLCFPPRGLPYSVGL